MGKWGSAVMKTDNDCFNTNHVTILASVKHSPTVFHGIYCNWL